MLEDVKQPEPEWKETRKQLRRLYTCTSGKHVGEVVWTVKTLGKYCDHKRIQKECKKFCCECCPKNIENMEKEKRRKKNEPGYGNFR